MNFGTFIASHVPGIIAEWETIARAFAPRRAVTREVLRDHWDEILTAIAAEMEGPAPAPQQAAQGAPSAPSALQHAAAQHGLRRQREHFELDELVAEFRAMRVTVLRAWPRSEDAAGDTLSVDETTRFSEALDRALAESIERYSADRARIRDLFLAVLGHDLRDPLSGINMATHVLDRPVLDDTLRVKAAVRIKRAVRVMDHLITDLLDFTRSRLGSGLPIHKTHCDLAQVAEDALEAVRTGVPEHRFDAELSGDLTLQADPARVAQLLSNLLYNAAQHGAPATPIALRIAGDADSVTVQVHNQGAPIPQEALAAVFEPLVQAAKRSGSKGARSSTSMGLGLFIAKEIVRGHGGTIGVESSKDAGTTFTFQLPRRSP
jgi:signal transduction histidine kinase